MIVSRFLLRELSQRGITRSLSSLSSFDVKPEQKTRELLDRVIRVDHSGELAAHRIYAGQMAVLGRTDVAPTIQVYLLFNAEIHQIICLFNSVCGMKKNYI